MMADYTQNAFSLKRIGGFRLSPSDTITIHPVFSGNGRYLAVNIKGSMVIHIWDVAAGEIVHVLTHKGISYPGYLAIDWAGRRLAVRDGSGKIDVLDIPSGHRVFQLKKDPMADGYCIALNPEGDLLFDADGSVNCGLRIWSVNSNKQEACFTSNLGCMPVAMSIAHAIPLVLVCYAGGQLPDSLSLIDSSAVKDISVDLKNSTSALSQDGQKIFLAGQTKSGEVMFRLMDTTGQVLHEKLMGDFPTFPVPTPCWSPDGTKIIWHFFTQSGMAWILDSETFDILDTVCWPSLSLALGPEDWVALAGQHGAVVPYKGLRETIDRLGEPAWYNEIEKFESAQRRVVLRKIDVPRVSIFAYDGVLRVEAEHLVGHFQYLPLEGCFSVLPEQSPAEEIGLCVIGALQQFVYTFTKTDPVKGFDLTKPNILLSLSLEERGRVRTLGYEDPPFLHPVVPADARYLSITFDQNIYDFWPSYNVNGKFFEKEIPHFALPKQASAVMIGAAVLKGIQMSSVLFETS